MDILRAFLYVHLLYVQTMLYHVRLSVYVQVCVIVLYVCLFILTCIYIVFYPVMMKNVPFCPILYYQRDSILFYSVLFYSILFYSVLFIFYKTYSIPICMCI